MQCYTYAHLRIQWHETFSTGKQNPHSAGKRKREKELVFLIFFVEYWSWAPDSMHVRYVYIRRICEAEQHVDLIVCTLFLRIVLMKWQTLTRSLTPSVARHTHRHIPTKSNGEKDTYSICIFKQVVRFACSAGFATFSLSFLSRAQRLYVCVKSEHWLWYPPKNDENRPISELLVKWFSAKTLYR